MDQDDDDVEITGVQGDEHLRNSAHARFDCVVCKFPADPKSNVEACKEYCGNCWCWVCDEQKCSDWAAHCMCDGSPSCACAIDRTGRSGLLQ